jgi:hypothetical protein
MATNKKEMIAQLVEDARRFKFCGPSDDPDEQTSVTTGYRHVVIQLKRLAGPLLPEAERLRLNSLEVEVNNIYSAYEAHAEIQTLLPDIEAALEHSNEAGLAIGTSAWIVDPSLIDRLAQTSSTAVDIEFLVRLCKEINSSFAHGNIVATALVMRAVLNYVPPAFGQGTFEQVVAHIGRSLKDSFGHLENGLRKIADFHTHRRIGSGDFYPSVAQVEPYKPQFELLLQQVVAKVGAGDAGETGTAPDHAGK